MKKSFFLAILAVLIGLSGCTKTRYVLVTSGQINVNAAKEAALKEAKRLEQVEEGLKQQDRWKVAFALDCPIGGYENVQIRPRLGKETLYWTGGGKYKIIFRRPILVHRAKNPYDNMTVNITDGEGYLVRNMCAGGTITLVKSMEFLGGQYLQVYWTAEGVVDGRIAYGDSPSAQLSAYDSQYEPKKKPPSWIMNLGRVDRKF